MRIDIGPAIGCRFTPIIKTCPYKSTHPIIIRPSQLPPCFSSACPPWRCNILVGHISSYAIFFINTSCSYGASHFCSDDRLIGMITVIIGNTKLTVIKTTNRDHFIDAVKNISNIGCISTGSAWIQFFLFSYKCLSDSFTIAGCMNPSFFITN